MLKIEKINRHHDYALELRERESFFNRTFLKALLVAFFLHGGALLIFHIGPFKLVNSGFLPPALVETDVAEGEQNVMAKIEGDSKLSRYPFAPKTLSLKLPSMPKMSMMRHLESVEEVNFLDNPFLKIERDLQNEIYFTSEIKQKSLSTVQIVLTGQLSEKKYRISEELSAFKSKSSFHAIYSVKVENKTGRIFFAESKETPGQYANVIDQILKEIRFEKEFIGFQTSGDIEIVFNGES